MKNVNLWVNGEGWKPFDLTTDEGKAKLKENGISIGSRSRIGDGSSIGYGSSIGDGIKVKTIFIQGSVHPVMYWGEDKIQIGCIQNTIKGWLKSKAVGVERGYTKEQIEEYKGYVLIIQEFHKTAAHEFCKIQ